MGRLRREECPRVGGRRVEQLEHREGVGRLSLSTRPRERVSNRTAPLEGLSAMPVASSSSVAAMGPRPRKRDIMRAEAPAVESKA